MNLTVKQMEKHQRQHKGRLFGLRVLSLALTFVTMVSDMTFTILYHLKFSTEVLLFSFLSLFFSF